jgi:hypothetical protein
MAFAEPGNSRRSGVWFWLVLLLAATAAVYWPGLGGGYAFDDFPNIVFNNALHAQSLQWSDLLAAAFSSHASELQRPLAMLSFAVQYYFTGLAPVPLKLANIAIHLFNTLLLFALVRKLLATTQAGGKHAGHTDSVALITAAFWALLPINLTAVLLIVQRMEILSHTFVFAGLWLYLDGRRRLIDGGPGWLRILAGLLPCTALGLLSKESAALLPLYAFCLEFFVFGFRTAGTTRDHRLLWLFGLVLLLPSVLGVAWLLPQALSPQAFSGRNFDLTERLLTEPRAVLDYLRWTLLPTLNQLGLYHDDYVVSRSVQQPPTTLLALLAIPALLAAAWCARRQRPLMALGLCWFLAAQALTATFLPLELVFEHRNYFASLGLCLVLVDVLLLSDGDARRQQAGWLVAILLLSFYGVTTYLRAVEWSDPLRFAVTEARKHPLSPRAAYQLGQTLVMASETGNNAALSTSAFMALERARSLPRSGILPVQGLLIFASSNKRPLKQEWWQDIDGKLQHDPIGAQELGALAALTRCAVEERCHFPQEQMLALFDASLSQGKNAEIFNIEGDYVLKVVREPSLAVRLWRESVALAPRNPQYRINLAELLIAVGDDAGARSQIAALRTIGGMGQTERSAQMLEAKLKGSMAGSE